MQFIVYAAAFLTLVLYRRSGAKYALIRGYLPILLLLPDCYRAITPGLPDPSFNQVAILPVFVGALLTLRQHWRLSVNDLLVSLFALCIAYSEFSNAGYAEAQNLMFAMFTSVVAPYFCARWCLQSQNDDIATARVFVFCCCLVSVISLYQFRFGINLWHLIFGTFFPGQGYGWVTTFRYGFARIAGPFSHAILAGIMLAMAWRLARWLQWGGCWEEKIRHFNLPGSKVLWINGILLLGIVMTIARGPWLGGVCGASLLWVAHGNNKIARLKWLLLIALVAGVLGQIALNTYLDLQPGGPMTQSQESALYRKELMQKYQAIAIEHAGFGWGRNTWPKVGGMESIDNYYLLLALMHGVIALTLLLAIMLWLLIRLVRKGLADPAGKASLPFTFAGIIVMVFVSLGTVYLGEQPLPAFFFILGWAESLLHRNREVSAPQPRPHSQPSSGFRHIMR